MSRYWLLVALLAVASTRLYGAEDSARVADLAAMLYTNAEIALYEMPLVPTASDTGIAAGVFVAYGHPVRRPYVVLRTDSTVLVNGIQVYPVLKPPAIQCRLDSLRTLAPSPLSDSVDTLVRRALRIYDTQVESMGHAGARDSAVAMLNRHPFVDSVRLGPHGYDIYFVRRAAAITVDFGRAKPLGGDESRQEVAYSKVQIVQAIASSIERMLSRGGVLFYHTHGGGSTSLRNLVAAKRVLEDTSATERDKYIRLSCLGVSPEWVLANYHEEEWQWIGQ